ncbi:hypothetical protein SS50377_22714 [Spironucleus salmonicida]|uniref:Uncharacterized protein n=1 Tax=Spironucleus salmonicida TaxID=348837 RepID=V6LKE6_9EUKA|nr:hypothetical protein SS50377_22709 [Spironucleus salmonicida]KAH0575092.1 hypothetical protein SS50377_22714 [Spironucleus salmonicida]|eukprot:EST44191.1 Hypothetical protein SS50377_15997 [Spironucleus salmonicida]
MPQFSFKSKNARVLQKIAAQRVQGLLEPDMLAGIAQRHPELQAALPPAPERRPKRTREQAVLQQREDRDAQRREQQAALDEGRRLKRKEYFRSHAKTRTGQPNFNRVMERLYGKLEQDLQK